MSDGVPNKPAPRAQSSAYKRSWKNLLLNKRYQLRFTLFMVGVAAVLMAVIGWRVMVVANEATSVAMARVRGEACPKSPEVIEMPSDDSGDVVPMNINEEGDGSAVEAAPAPVPSPKPEPSKVDPKQVAANNAQNDVLAVKALWCTDAECKPETAAPLQIKVKDCDAYVKKRFEDAQAVDALRRLSIAVVKCEGGGEPFSVADADPERHATVQLDESSMTMTPTLPTDYADRIVSHHLCEMRQAGQMDALQQGRLRILYVLILTGILMMIGLAFYGIKMTHKVAGPLHKVTLYLAKMRDGRLDKVWNLRKGDQLVDFYDHFKGAHAGVVQLEKDDIAQLKATIEAAEAAGVDPTLIADLRTVLARKEKSIE
jgi:hypothetical protein